ncbi:cytochrome c oxidase assembly protein [Plastoroseomonas hellenica]|uniref:cytochrome c oxidase assembly protein n=1 Tax=Plastoroseomonas hellenica TaxID=2687306 RepID=UPI001BA4F109|nr:cytochrome c oxidase assembly protein [Plastoroseomonas hellenica]MBR0645407.1 cytochrome c oxidase assembly protein [Plastoroseomonas hellenica]
MRALAPRAVLALAAVLPAAALAHGDAMEDGRLPWTFDPWVVTPLLACLLLYGLGLSALWRRAGAGRGIGMAQAVAYLCGWLALAGALTSPLHWLGEHLFTAHMIEHELVMAVAAPLLVLGRPLAAALWAFPSRPRQRLARIARSPPARVGWRALTLPPVATLLHGIAIWSWHLPPLFDATVTDVGLHRLQHLSFVLTALLFWWALLRRSHPLAASAHLFVTMVHTGILGALLTFAPRVLYAVQTMEASRWGLTPLEDQQLAGVVMWAPGGLIYAGAALGFIALHLARLGRRPAGFRPLEAP